MKLLKILALLALVYGISPAQNRRVDTLFTNKGVEFDSLGAQSVTGTSDGFVFARGSAGIFYSYSGGIVRLDSAGTSTVVTSDTTINVTLNGITYTVKVDSTVMETINNSILRAKNGIQVVYSATGPDSVGIDSTYTATKADFAAMFGLYGPGKDGNITPAADTTLTRDMYADNLTLNSGIDLYPAGYRIFVRGTLNLATTATINDTGARGANGGNGTNVTTNSTNGAVGTAAGATAGKGDGYLHRQNSDAAFGGNGGQAAGGAGAAGNGAAGTSKSQCIARNNGGSGGVGGLNSGNPFAGGTGGTGGVRTAPNGTYGLFEDFVSAYQAKGTGVVATIGSNVTGSSPEVSVGGGGGGSGAGLSSTGSSNGGGFSYGGPGAGGSGGAGGGLVWIAAKYITGTGTITVKGGGGGNGGNGGTCSGGTSFNGGGNSGAGGGGGTGGAIFLFYHNLAATVAMDTTGGSAGSAGTPGTATGAGPAVSGNAGSAGNSGGAGFTVQFKFGPN